MGKSKRIKTMGMTKDEINGNLIFEMLRGSHAYGTTVPDSDRDYGGICMPSKKVLFGIEKFEQDDTNWFEPDGEEVDKTVYGFNKSIELMLNNNPNMLDYLFGAERCILHITPAWEAVRDIRDSFISLQTKHSFHGYGMQQLSRMETHRSYLLNPVARPNRIDFDLGPDIAFPKSQLEAIASISTNYVDPDDRDDFYRDMSFLLDRDGTQIFKDYIPIAHYQRAISLFKVRQKEFLAMISSIDSVFLNEKYVGLAQKELKYLAAKENWKRYQSWEKNRNEKRQVLERKCGFDSKHGMHLTRLLRMSVEILEGKGVLVDRTDIDAEELVDMRNGLYKYDEVLQMSKDLSKRASELYETSTLPLLPDSKTVNELRYKLLEEHTLNIMKAQ
jgi:uncharacterized protein